MSENTFGCLVAIEYGNTMNGSYSISYAIPRCKREGEANKAATVSGIIEMRKAVKKMDKKAQARRYEARKDAAGAIFR